jgi:late competence protein required for DNA uptake (superfamily II DNA/RNA helicase)
MKDAYNRKLQCPKCNSKKIGFIKDSEGKSSNLLYCESCGMIGSVLAFRALPSLPENPSRRDSDLEDPDEPRAF